VGLKEYRRKRDFDRTPEPPPPPRSRTSKSSRTKSKSPRAEAPAGERFFCVQKHAATNTHYDLRLELGGVLKSWAVPKGPSFDPREKRLAVHVEDHPLEYGSFEGTIPKGQYGGGTVMLWDRGTWTPIGDNAEKDYAAGKLKFRLNGERLRGRWMLVRTRTGVGEKRTGPPPDHWLLFKERDNEANPALSAEAFATSVATGRTMDEIAAGAPACSAPADPPPSAPAAASLPGARPAEMPRAIKPMLAAPVERTPDGPEWLHEVKFDGYRFLIFRRGDSVRIITRRGHNWTEKLPDLAAAVLDRVRTDAVLDGEAVILDRRGISDFQALQNAIDSRRSAAIVFFAFDLPWCDGHDLTRVPLIERRRLLAHLIGTRQEGRLRLSEAQEGNGPAVFRTICAHGLEGVISKRKDSAYEAGRRSPAWAKSKCFNTQEFVIGGFSAPEGTREEFGALLLGYYDDAGDLVFAGKVGTGFSSETLRRLGAQLRPLSRPKPPFRNPPTGADARGVTWVKPELVADVQFRDWTEEGVIRHTSFRGLRADIKPVDVRRQPIVVAGASADPPREPARTQAPARVPAAEPVGVRLTHPDRVVYPDRGAGYTVTKRQLAEYYEAVGPIMLPHVAGRPLTIVRCPDGEGGNAFYQKRRAAGMPKAVLACHVPDPDNPEEEGPCLMVRSVEGLVGLAQINALEIHPWGARADNPERPDRLVFDLDPGPGVEWKRLVEAALLLRDALSQIALTPFLRTTGGKGLHVVVPIERRYTWDQVKTFTKGVADALVRLSPRSFVAVSTRTRREDRIYIDYLRNTRGATAIGPYSTRNRPGATVATPLFWDELTPDLDPAAFNVLSVPRRLASIARDPWHDIADRAARLPI